MVLGDAERRNVSGGSITWKVLCNGKGCTVAGICGRQDASTDAEDSVRLLTCFRVFQAEQA